MFADACPSLCVCVTYSGYWQPHHSLQNIRPNDLCRSQQFFVLAIFSAKIDVSPIHSIILFDVASVPCCCCSCFLRPIVDKCKALFYVLPAKLYGYWHWNAIGISSFVLDFLHSKSLNRIWRYMDLICVSIIEFTLAYRLILFPRQFGFVIYWIIIMIVMLMLYGYWNILMKTPSLICKIYDLTIVAVAMVLHRLPDESMILIPHHTKRQHIYNSNCIDFCLLFYCLAESLCVCRALLSRFSIQIQIFSDKTGRHTRETEPSKTLTTSMTKSHTQHLYYLIGRLRLWRARFKCEMDVWIYEYHVNCNLFHSIPTITLRTSSRVFICFFVVFSFFLPPPPDWPPPTRNKIQTCSPIHSLIGHWQSA